MTSLRSSGLTYDEFYDDLVKMVSSLKRLGVLVSSPYRMRRHRAH